MTKSVAHHDDRSNQRHLPRRLSARSGSASAHFDPLEPRQLLTTTVSNGLDAFFANLALTLHANHNGEDVAFGYAVVNLGDLNADGADDLAIGAPGGGSAMGLVDVYNGKTGALLWTVAGDAVGFARSLARIADVTGDSIADLVVGSPNSGSAGSVFIYSGATGALFGQIIGSEHGASAGAHFGWSVASGTLDADASPDLAIGAPSDGASTSGRVYLIGASNAGLLGVIEGEQPGELFGWAVALARTPSHDFNDILVGAPGWDAVSSSENGRVARHHSDGTQVFSIGGRDAGDLTGYSVLAISNGNTPYDDMAYGSPGADAWGLDSLLASDAGIVQIVDIQGRLGAIIAGTHTGSLFGAALAQVERPGNYYSPAPLIAIAAPGAPGGGMVQVHDSTHYAYDDSTVAWIVPTHTTSLLYQTLRGDADRAFGVALAMGDFNADGIPDVAIADAPQVTIHADTNTDNTGTGSVRVYRSVDNPQDYTTHAMSTSGQYVAFRTMRTQRLWLAGPGGVSVVLPPDASSDDFAVDVANSGKVLLSRRRDVQGEGTYFDSWVFENGALSKLADSVTTFVGAPAEWTFYPDLKPLAILPDGSVIIERFVTNLHSPVIIQDQTIWRVEGTTATYLWRGQYTGHSAAGVVGRRFESYNAQTGDYTWTTMLWRQSAGIEAIAIIQNAFAIDDNASVFGVDFATKNMIRRDVDATTTVLFTVDTEYAVTIYAKAADSHGRLLWMITDSRYAPPGPGPNYWTVGELRVFDPINSTNTLVAESTIMLRQIAYGTVSTTSHVAFTSDGGYLVGSEHYANTVALSLYSQGIDQRLLTPADLAAAATATGDQWTASLFVNSLGRLTLMINEGDGSWRVRNVSLASSDSLSFDGFAPIVAWNDPLTQRPQFATLDRFERFVHVASYSTTDNGYPRAYASWEAHSPQFNGVGVDGTGSFLTAMIGPSRDMTALVRPDNNVIVAFRMNDGRIALIGQGYNSTINPFSFNILYDLTYSELVPKGLPTPEIIGPISGFVSPWGGHNITGVDASGHIWTLWTSPEFVGWTITDLTDWLNTDPISGGVSSFLTTWNAFNMTGLNSAGELVTMWWAPELGPGNWQVDFIGQGQTTWDNSVQIESWFNAVEQSLNFIGKDQSGQITCYTWRVSDQTWRSEVVQPISAADRVSRVSPDRGRPSVSRAVGLGASGHLLWFYRTNDVASWAFEDITDLIA